MAFRVGKTSIISRNSLLCQVGVLQYIRVFASQLALQAVLAAFDTLQVLQYRDFSAMKANAHSAFLCRYRLLRRSTFGSC